MKYELKYKENFKELLEQYGSPLYLYNSEVLQDRANKILLLKKELEAKLKDIKVNMHYSLKANNNPAIVKTVKNAGLFVDSMSRLELDICKKCGFKNNEILYVCNNIDAEEMKWVKNEGILICLDSISQVETWGKLFPNTDIMVRINPGTEGIGHSEKVVTSGKFTKFGISEENLKELFETTKKYNLNIIGTHQHLGSLFLNDKIHEYIEGVKAGLRIVKKYFKNIEIIDLGGGFGIPYTNNENKLDLSKVALELEKVLVPFVEEYPSVKEFKFEPGRFIPCESGILLGKVTAVKHENETWWIGTDIGMNEIVRPTMYNAYHEIDILSNDSREIIANICGNICESGDILGKERRIPIPKVGDIIVVYDAGAYGYSMASNYTGRTRPAEIIIENGKERLIRKREEIDFLESNIIW